MNYTTLLKHILEAALSCPNVNSFYSGEVYEDWAKTTKYSSVVCSLENITRNETTITYNVIIYYGDRLLQNDINTIALYDDGVAIIQHILDTIPEEVIYAAPIIFTPFAQQFMDYIGGAYARISFTVPYSLCDFDNDEPIPEKTLEITNNGKYSVKGYDYTNVQVSDPESQKKIEELTEELNKANDEIDVLNYEINRINGEISSDRPITINENGTTSIEGLGYNNITVNVRNVEAVTITQAEYDALTEYDDYKIYLITE